MKSKINSAIILGLVIAAFITVTNCRQEDGSCQCPHSKFEEGIYYSQTYEDYILAYVFKNMDTGFYVDVGANDPNIFNVTRFFYERGWRGVNIEPNVDLFKKIVQYRPRDFNYNYGISNAEGNFKFYQQTKDDDHLMPLSTFDKAIAERHKKEGINFTEILVPITTLNNLLAKIAIPEITFISIDVEGFEKQVIESINLAKYRPVVLCIEATQPGTDIPSYMGWEKIVLDNNYVLAMSDGMNRYYLHKSHIELLPRFIDIDRCVKLSKYKRQVRIDGWRSW